MTDSSGPVKRVYESALRQAQARATRRQIIDAAGRLFSERGYAATSVDQIAQAAGVSRPTVFTSLGGKPALLEAAWNVALVGDDEPVALPDRSRSREIMAETDPYRFLSAYVALVVEVHTRVAGIFDAMRAAATADPAIASLYDKIQADRYMGATHVVELLLSKGQLRPGLARDVAVDVLWALIEPTMYRLFVGERGWPVERYRSWLDQTLQAQLLPVRADQEAAERRGGSP